MSTQDMRRMSVNVTWEEAGSAAPSLSATEQLAKLEVELEAKAKNVDREHPESVFETLNEIALLQQKLGRLDDALVTLENACELVEALGVEDTMSCAQVLHNLAAMFKRQAVMQTDAAAKKEKLGHAQQTFKRALAIKGANVGEKHASYALTLHNIGLCQKDAGSTDQALITLQEALRIKGACADLGTESLSYAETLAAIANIIMAQGNTAQAISAMEQVRSKQMRYFDGDSECAGVRCDPKSYTGTLNNLALAYSKQGELSSSIAMFREGLEIVERYEGKESKRYGDMAYNLAIVYKKSGDVESAVQWFTDAGETYKAACGPESKQYKDVTSRRNDLVNKDDNRLFCCSSGFPSVHRSPVQLPRAATFNEEEDKKAKKSGVTVMGILSNLIHACQGRQ